jgi:uncharacterized protein (UPF0332 family)
VGNLRSKSELNLTAANYLCQEKLFAPAVHCSYYSAFQIMKFVIKDFFGCNYEAQEEEHKLLKTKKATKDIGTHEYIIKKFGDAVHDLSLTDYIFFNRRIKDLKKYRIDSDYKDVKIEEKEGVQSYVFSQEVFNKMVELFHV